MKNIKISEGIAGYQEFIPESSSVYVVIDKNLKSFYHNFEQYNLIEISTSESLKVFDTVAYVVEQLLEGGADRDAFVLGVGGGITTDIAGFVASIYKRGVRFGFVPTTLLSQVDASIGGKNGVNFKSYKNIIGVINQPEFVYVCSELLTTLEPREFRAGIAEMLKSFIIFDKSAYRRAVDYFTMLESYRLANNRYLLEGSAEFADQQTLTKLIGLCAGYKSGVVERDEFERGERRLLNLGHTFAHAIEKLCGASGIMHGEAVSMGLVIAAKLAERVAATNSGFACELEANLESVGLPVGLPEGVSMSNLLAVVTKDKKVSGSGIHFILPYGLERVEDRLIELKELEELVYDLC